MAQDKAERPRLTGVTTELSGNVNSYMYENHPKEVEICRLVMEEEEAEDSGRELPGEESPGSVAGSGERHPRGRMSASDGADFQGMPGV